MRRILQVVSWAALAVTALAPILFVAGQIALSHTKLMMSLAAIAWFVTTPLWMGRPNVDETLVI